MTPKQRQRLAKALERAPDDARRPLTVITPWGTLSGEAAGRF